MRGDGRIFERGAWLWVSYSYDGKEYREAAKDKNGKNTNDRATAERFLQARLKEKHAAEIGARVFETPAAKRLTVAELCAAVESDLRLRGKASPQNLCNLARVEKDFGDSRASAVSPGQIDAYIQERLAVGDRPATINRTLQLLHQAFALAVRRGTLSRVPYIRRLSEAGNARQGFFSEQDFSAVVPHLPADLRDFARFAFITGMRKGEVASLKWSDVLGDVLTLRGEDSKNGESRTIPLVGELAQLIERRKRSRPVKEENGGVRFVETIFHRDGAPVAEFRKSWATACVAAGFGKMVCPKCESAGSAHMCERCETETKYRGRIFHDLRRSAVRSMTQAGVPQAVAMKISGHKTASMFQRYNIVATDDLRAALERTEKFREAAAKQPQVVSIGRS